MALCCLFGLLGTVCVGKADEKALVQSGKAIFYGKGRCGICHTIGVAHGGKCPNLDYAGSRLTRNFIYEAMTNPSAYIKLDFDLNEPDFYPARMPQVNRSPIGLSENEIQDVIAFIGSQRVVGAGLPRP
jgi:hypothetical protein